MSKCQDCKKESKKRTIHGRCPKCHKNWISISKNMKRYEKFWKAK